MTVYPPQIQQDLSNATVFLDTNVFGSATRSESFFNFLVDLKENSSCSYSTIPSVLFEVVNGSSTLEIYNQRADFLRSLVDTIDPVKFIDRIEEFSVVMAKLNAQNKAYTDFLLACCLYNYRKSGNVYLLTSDLKALPSFFKRTHIIATEESKGDIRNFGVYSLNLSAYLKAASSLLAEL